MGAGNPEHVDVAQHFTRQPFRPGSVGNAALEQRLDDRLARVITLPTTTTSGRGMSWPASKPEVSAMPSDSSCVLMGG